MKIIKSNPSFLAITISAIAIFTNCLSKTEASSNPNQNIDNKASTECLNKDESSYYNSQYYRKAQDVAEAISLYNYALKCYHGCSSLTPSEEFEANKKFLGEREKALEKVIYNNTSILSTVTNTKSSLPITIADAIDGVNPIVKGVVHIMESESKRYMIKKWLGIYLGFVALYAVILSKACAKACKKTSYGLDDINNSELKTD
jgi:hypothetical protein